MKKYLYVLSLLPLLLGCTLSMEEYVESEEEKGFDQPYTIENEAGSVTYQFQDGVIYVSDNVQEYLAQVDHDTILYFMTSLPQQWRPQVGSKLASGCTHKLPYGLNHRVLSVDDVGGFLKVVCTKTTQEDVYKELSYCIDADIACADLSSLDEGTLAALGYEVRDSVLMDWNLYDSIKGISHPEMPVTRAENEDMEEVTLGDDKTNKNVFIDWYIDTRNIGKLVTGIGKAATTLKDYQKGIEKQLASEGQKHPFLNNLFVGFGVKITHFERAHAEKDEKKKYELNYTDTWTETELKIEAGAEFKKTPQDKLTRAKMGKTSLEFTGTSGINWALIESNTSTTHGTQFVNTEMVPEGKKTWANATIRIIIPAGPVPLAFIASSTLNPELSVGGSVSASGTYTSDVRRTGYEVKNGKKTNIDRTMKDGEWHFDNVALNGHFKVGASFRAAAGLEVAGTFAATVGANVECFFTGEGSIKFNNTSNGEKVQPVEPTGKVRFYLDFYGDVQLHVAPLGIHVWDKQIAKFLTVHLLDFNSKLEPDVKYVGGWCNSWEDEYKCTGYYELRNLSGIHCLTTLRKYVPAMRLYVGPVEDNAYVYMDYDEEDKDAPYTSVEENKKYRFVAKGELRRLTTEMHMRPCLVSRDEKGVITDMILTPMENSYWVEVGDPHIMTLYTCQTCGIASFDYSNLQGTDGFIDAEKGATGPMSMDMTNVNLRQYKMITNVSVTNGSRIQKWGIKVKIYSPDGKQLLRKKVPVKKTASGTYTLIFSFFTNWELTGSGQKMYYVVQPYWEDLNGGKKSEASDDNSTKQHPLEYDMEDNTSNINNKNGDVWGTILPEIDLD